MKTIIVSNFSNHNKKVVDLTIKNHYEYCNKYNIDFLYTMSQYSPINNFNQIIILLNLYDNIITIGTDILFTNFDKDIHDFIDLNYDIIIQDEGTNSVNGDFIIWNKTKNIFETIQFLKNHSDECGATQYLFNRYKSKLNMQVLPPRTLQSICPYGNEHNKNITHLLWKQNDFSVHCHRPGITPDINHKINDLNEFIKNHFPSK